jgi:hypothetical protein
MTLPPLMVEDINGVLVVRDDRVPGGTKRRVLAPLLGGADEWVYASPCQGYAQVALAHACREQGKRATVFVARRAAPHKRTVEAIAAGARIVQVPVGYMTVVAARARAYAEQTGAGLLPFGFDTPPFIAALADLARSLALSPSEVWAVAGSGTLSRALQQAWPDAAHHAVRIGAVPKAGRAQLYQAPEPFERDAQIPPPFPSCSNYDAKAWRFIMRHASPGSVFWNVAA